MEQLALAMPHDPLIALRHAVDRLAALHTAVKAGERTVERTASVVMDPQAFRVGLVDEQGRLGWRFAVDGQLVLDIRLERARPHWGLVGPEPSWDWTTGFEELYETVDGVGDDARWCDLSDTLHVMAEPWQLSVRIEPSLGHTVTDRDVAAACAAARAVLASRIHPGLPIDRDADLCAAIAEERPRKWFRRSRSA